jgi:alanine dehydrogenase
LEDSTFNIGMARMHKEPGERRDFLPKFIARLVKQGAHISLEYGYGSGMGLVEGDYLRLAPSVAFVPKEEIFSQDYVLVVRYPADEDICLMKPGSCLISMLHYPTRPLRVEFLHSLNIEAISLDSIKDDSGRRLVENLKAVGWNGMEMAFEVLRSTYPAPGFGSPERGSIHVTLLGAGSVGMHVIQAAIHYADDSARQHMASLSIPGVQVTAVDYDVTPHEDIMKEILNRTDILVDATQRPDPSAPVIPNEWIAYLPEHAVLLDLSVDPYNCDMTPISMKGIEGIPQGNLDQYIFGPNDPAFDLLPECVDTRNRRYSVSCYSWPGIYPKQCMELYGRQMRPLLRTLIEIGGVGNIDPEGKFFERAIARGLLSRWKG